MGLGDGIARNKGRKGYAFQKGYNTAIDEFVHNAEVKIYDRILQNQSRLEFASGLAVANRILDEIAEQLKGGAE